MIKTLSRALGAAIFLCASAVTAQDYPIRNVVLVVPFAAGGPTDTLARNLAVVMSNSLKQQVIVENVVGAGGTIAYGRVAKSKPDGYYVLLAHIGMSTAPALYRKPSVNPLTDFEYIGQVADVPMTLIAKTALPPDNLKDLITYIKANREKINLGNAGLGAASHLCGMLFTSAIQTDLTAVPYNGTGPAMAALMGGQIDLMCDQTTNTTAQIKSGRVKVYGVTTVKRVESLKDIPTLDEQGLKNFQIGIWHGLYAPKGTPKEAVDKLSAALQEAVKDPAVIQRFAELGATTYPPERATPAALQAHLKAEIDKWGPIIKKAGVYAD